MAENSGQDENRGPTIKHVDDCEFQRYFDRLEGSEEGYEIKLYRRIRSGKSKVITTYLKKYVDELPDEDTIGNEFGGGHYMLLHYQENGNRLEKTIWIDEIFTKRLEEKNRVSGMPPNIELLQPRIEPLEYFSKIVNDMLKPMVEMFTQNQNQGPQIQTQDPSGLAVRMMERMTESMAASLAKVQERVIDRQLERFDEPRDKPEQMTDKMAFIKEILGFAKQFGESLINANGTKEKLMKAAIAGSDEFKTIANDPDMFDALYTEAVNDPEIGRDKANKLFEKLGFEIGKETT